MVFDDSSFLINTDTLSFSKSIASVFIFLLDDKLLNKTMLDKRLVLPSHLIQHCN